MILKFDFKTPGREEDGGETKLYSKAEYKAAKAAEKDGGAAAPQLTVTSTHLAQQASSNARWRREHHHREQLRNPPARLRC